MRRGAPPSRSEPSARLTRLQRPMQPQPDPRRRRPPRRSRACMRRWTSMLSSTRCAASRWCGTRRHGPVDGRACDTYGVLCLALTRGSRQDRIAASVERSVVWASLSVACGSACGVARLDSVDASARHGVQHDSKRLERAVADWFDRASAGRHSPPHALDHCFAARRVMRCRCLTLCPQSGHARAHTWP